jgi:cobalt-zinc-cadmium efflux system protein
MAHVHGGKGNKKVLIIATILTLGFVAFEAVAGHIGNSLALISDAGHNLADVLALIISLGAILISERPANNMKTYGYHRWNILAALVNATALILLSLYIFWEASSRIAGSEAVNSGFMISVAAISILLNGIITYTLSGSKNNLNMRSAYVHMLGDAFAALGVVIVGIIIYYSHAYWLDSVASVGIAIFILYSSWGILNEAVNILLESVPKGINLEEVTKVIQAVPGVVLAHDLHVWTISSGMIACSCHIVVSEHSIKSGQQVMRSVIQELEQKFDINHTTIQVEGDGCDPLETNCFPQSREIKHSH